ncbi:flavodoxin family protein [Aurantimonas aggregata]|uniref:Flavodoxin family protein n=1 Tax=Aurantimonas aggregata TaxID=2047720 RepID=A0A6L9MIP9_9HYPH|nr:NAD(P)H-dependent oxidoreductase [Aurantimonas aggregata]NDV87677.1 flavodoxin family protein [Aurantimonas aggregata]
MAKALVLVFHRDLSKSKANAALAIAADGIDGVEVVDVQARYRDGVIDMTKAAGSEAEKLLGAERIVLQFPIQWYSTPALLKAWQDAVLTRMYYVYPREEGGRLAGTPLMVAATAGNAPEAYGRDGGNHFSIDEILTPLKATAHRCSLPWQEPHIVFTADKLQPEALEQAARGYERALRNFISRTPGRAVQWAA